MARTPICSFLFESVRATQWQVMLAYPLWCLFFFRRRMIEFKVRFFFVPSVRKGFAMRFTLLDSHELLERVPWRALSRKLAIS